MDEKHLVVSNITVYELEEMLRKVITELLKGKVYNGKSSTRYLTREETAKKLRISLPTLTNLTNDGILTGYKIGKRILYKESEVEKSLSDVEVKIFKRNRR